MDSGWGNSYAFAIFIIIIIIIEQSLTATKKGLGQQTPQRSLSPEAESSQADYSLKINYCYCEWGNNFVGCSMIRPTCARSGRRCRCPYMAEIPLAGFYGTYVLE